jgi:hypothetical protein
MLAGQSKNNKLLKAMERAHQYARALEEREKQDHRYGILFFLLAISVVGLVFLLIRSFA